MDEKIETYEKKLYDSRLVPEKKALFVMAGETHRRGENGAIPVLSELADRLCANTLLFARPAEPYRTIIEFLAANASGAVFPDDSETRTFLVDIPVADRFSADALYSTLQERKCLIIPGRGIVSLGKTGPSEAYVHFAAACFACFVKFFSDFLKNAYNRHIADDQQIVFQQARKSLPPPPVFAGGLASAPIDTTEKTRTAIIEAGKRIVSSGLVDASFGNISFRVDNTLYISNTGSFLDHLEEDISACPLDDPECTGQRPSSEYPAHLEIMRTTDAKGVLHGHPLFSVIMSMDCRIDCGHRGDCHRTCPHARSVCGIPIVPGETGGGPFGLYTTVPGVIKEGKSAIVFGHGVFTATKTDFNDALANMVQIEQACREEYFDRLKQLCAK
ncbi:MAG: class II aldolase/adducin family protein [Desulfosalsimonadaceae bacterium]